MSPNENNNWFVYMIRCDDGSLYTGITTDMARRWREHSGERARQGVRKEGDDAPCDKSRSVGNTRSVSNTESVDKESTSSVAESHRPSSGLCKDASRRVENLRSTNNQSQRGAKFFRGRKPLQLAYIESGHDRSSASRREAAIKRLPRTAKLQLLTADLNELHTLDRALLPMFDS